MYCPDVTKHIISLKSLRASSDNTTIKDIRKKIKTLAFVKEKNLLLIPFEINDIKQSDYPVLESIVSDYGPVADDRAHYSGIPPEEIGKILSQSRSCNYKVFCFDYETRFLANPDSKLFYNRDLEVFTSKSSEQVTSNLIISFSLYNDCVDFIYAPDPQELGSHLSNLNISILSISMIVTPVLEKLLDAAAQLPALSHVKQASRFY